MGGGGGCRGTGAGITLPDGRFWVGVTLCSPSDQFVKATGRNKAIGRAYRNARRDRNLLGDGFDVIEFQNNGDEAVNAGTDWSGRLKARLRVEIDEMKKDRGIR